MSRFARLASGTLLAAGAALALHALPPAAVAETVAAGPLPVPALDAAPATGLQTAVFAGGCFWGIQAVFQHVAGVTEAVSGYAGGTLANPSYEQVSAGTTGHAEVVRVTFDPAKVSYGTLLRIFFSVALDPTEVNRQGPDTGTQYRSDLFAETPEQAAVATAYIAQLDAAHLFPAPIATRVDKAVPFFPAEAYHQDYLHQHPNNPYIVVNDAPKVQALAARFPEHWQAQPAAVGRLALAK